MKSGIRVIFDITFSFNCASFPVVFQLGRKISRNISGEFLLYSCAFTLSGAARAKSETIIYNVFPPDVWLTPRVEWNFPVDVRSQNGYLIIHLLLSF